MRNPINQTPSDGSHGPFGKLTRTIIYHNYSYILCYKNWDEFIDVFRCTIATQKLVDSLLNKQYIFYRKRSLSG